MGDAAGPADPSGPDWLEARVEAPRGADEAAVERLEDWLTEAGALSITSLDAEAPRDGAGEARGVDDEATLAHAVLEPAPGETRLWRSVALVALFERGSDPDAVRAALAGAAGALGLDPAPAASFRRLADTAWERVWMDDFRPMRFGPRFVVAPHHALGAPARGDGDRDGAGIADDDVVLALDPGLAFGTGTHPTTAQCLAWLGAGTAAGAAPFAGRTVIDYGCGSGVLAVAAALLGARRAIAVDIDPQALEATRDNARANGVAECVEVGPPTLLDGAPPADVLLANILHGPLVELADRLTALVRPGGALVLSGVLVSQGPSLRVRYTPGFAFGPDASRDGWALLSATRRDDPPPRVGAAGPAAR